MPTDEQNSSAQEYAISVLVKAGFVVTDGDRDGSRVYLTAPDGGEITVGVEA